MMCSIVQRVLEAQPQWQRIYANLRNYGRLADQIADVPAQVFHGLDIADLNRNGIAINDEEARTHRVGNLCVVNEVLGHADPALAIALPGGSLTLAVIDFACREQKEKILARFDSSQPVWGAFAMTEPTSGTDATRMSTVATRVSGGYCLNGEKCFIGNAGRSAYVIVFATVAPEMGQFGIRAFFVPIPSNGLLINDRERMLGLRAVRASRMVLQDCFVADEDVIGFGTSFDPARSFAYAQASWNAMRPCLGSLILGATQRVLNDLQDDLDGHASSLRHGAFALIHEYANKLVSARLLCRRAAALIDAGAPSPAASSIAKTYASDCARQCIEHVMNLPGIALHASFLDFSRWRRDFYAFNIMEGTGDIHRLMIAHDRNRQRNMLVPILCDDARPISRQRSKPEVV